MMPKKNTWQKHGKRKTIFACVPFGMFPPPKKDKEPQKKNRRTPQAPKEQTFFPMDGISEESACPDTQIPHIYESISCSWFRNPANSPVEGTVVYPSLEKRVYTSQVVVWDFVHQQFFLFNFKFSTSKCHFRFLDGLKPPTIWKAAVAVNFHQKT